MLRPVFTERPNSDLELCAALIALRVILLVHVDFDTSIWTDAHWP